MVMVDDEDRKEDENQGGGDDPERPAEGGEEEGGAENGGEETDSRKKLIIIVAGVVLLLVAVGGGLFFTGILDSVLGRSESGHAEGGAGEDLHGKKKAAKKKKHGGHGGGHGDGHGGAVDGAVFLAIPPITVNLNAEDGTPRYLRLTVQLELESEEDMHAVEAIMPRVVDQFQTYLRELRVKDLRGSAGIYRLQMELLWRVNQAAAPVEVKDVLFQEFLIQ